MKFSVKKIHHLKIPKKAGNFVSLEKWEPCLMMKILISGDVLAYEPMLCVSKE